VNGGAFAIAGFLWAFWPGVVLASPRIGNDILFALAHVLCLWSCLRYLTQKNGRDLIYAAMFCWGAFYAKTTGTVTIALWFVTFVLGYFPRNRWKLTKAEFVALGLFLLLMVTVAWQQTRSVPLIGNLDALNSALKVGNEPRNYLFFDIRDYLTNSYTNGWDDAGGR
jgi:predicted membrane-bound mannosyltransferase